MFLVRLFFPPGLFRERVRGTTSASETELCWSTVTASVGPPGRVKQRWRRFCTLVIPCELQPSQGAGASPFGGTLAQIRRCPLPGLGYGWELATPLHQTLP